MNAAAQIDGDLAERVRRVALLTGRPVSQVVRQGLIRVVSEAEALGSFTWHQLPPAGPDLLSDALPPRRKRRTGLRMFDDPVPPWRRPRRRYNPLTTPTA
jgi:hypothetical protein